MCQAQAYGVKHEALEIVCMPCICMEIADSYNFTKLAKAHRIWSKWG